MRLRGCEKPAPTHKTRHSEVQGLPGLANWQLSVSAWGVAARPNAKAKC